MPIVSEIPFAQNVSADLVSKRKLKYLKILVSVLASIQAVSGIIGFCLFFTLNREFLPRFKNYMEPLESRLYTQVLYLVDLFMAIWLISIWKPATTAIKFWIITSLMLTLLTTTSFFWAIPYGYSTDWLIQVIFYAGLLFRILEICIVRKYYHDYISSLDAIYPFPLSRRQFNNIWPGRSEGMNVTIGRIPTN